MSPDAFNRLGCSLWLNTSLFASQTDSSIKPQTIWTHLIKEGLCLYWDSQQKNWIVVSWYVCCLPNHPLTILLFLIHLWDIFNFSIILRISLEFKKKNSNSLEFLLHPVFKCYQREFLAWVIKPVQVKTLVPLNLWNSIDILLY